MLQQAHHVRHRQCRLAVVGPGARIGDANMLDAGLKIGAGAEIAARTLAF